MKQFPQFWFKGFHQILIWPLELIRPLPLDEMAALMKKAGWDEEIPNLSDRGTATGEDTPFQEFVYFHPFARSFLYPGAGNREHIGAFRLLSRSDISQVRVELSRCDDKGVVHSAGVETLDVDRVHLYLFRTQVAILVVEVSAKREISRESVLRLEDQLRRVYAPFWMTTTDKKRVGGSCPLSVEWLTDGEPVGKASDYGNKEGAVKAVAQGNPPVAAHWRWLLEGSEVAPDSDLWFDKNFGQIEDDRAPAMVALISAAPGNVSRPDLVRHCFYDGEDGPSSFPYSPPFLAEFEENHAYRRFWDPASGWNTIYLCSGYGFTLLTEEGWRGGMLLEHFRHHYFQLGLLAHFHRASLLRFSRRFNAVMLPGDAKHWDRLQDLREEFAKFISTSWFHEVSNQEQGRELFSLWTKHLGSEQLMGNILTEARAVDEILSAHREEERAEENLKLTKSQTELAEAQKTLTEVHHQLTIRVNRLTILLFLMAGATLVVALLDTEVVRDLMKAHGGESSPWFWKWSLAWAAGIGLGLRWVYHKIVPEDSKREPTQAALDRALFWGLLVLLAVGLIAATADANWFHRLLG